MKEYKFTTFNKLGEEIETYKYFGYSAKDIKEIAVKIIANSMQGETRHSRITLA